MLKKVLTAIFILVFTVFALDYFKLLPSDRQLGFNKISTRQQNQINSFTVLEKQEESSKFTDRVVKNNRPF
ncbi:MAG TPA: hypothetical protein DCL21_05485 [Alphaproteobacteria bacterium]|nr:hypothetical protein [Alphaproteobacteria bacterium]